MQHTINEFGTFFWIYTRENINNKMIFTGISKKMEVGDTLVEKNTKGKILITYHVKEIIERRDAKGIWKDKSLAENSFFKVSCSIN